MLNDMETFSWYTTIFGVTPYAKNNSKRCQNWQQLFALIFFLLNISITVYGIIQLKHDYNLISNFTRRVLLLIHIIAVAIILLESVFTATEHKRFYTQCHRIELLYSRQLYYKFCEHNRRSHIRWKYFLLALIAFGCPITYMLLTWIHHYHSYIPYGFCSLVVLRLRQIQFLIYAEVIGSYIEVLNVKLSAVVSCKHNRQLLDINCEWIESLEYLLLLKSLHLEICKLTQCWNNCFGWSTFAVIKTLFLDIVFYGYWTFLTSVEVYPIFLMSSCIIMLVCLMVLYFTACYTCQQCENSCRQTLALVQKLLLNTAGDVNVRIYNDLVSEFSTQIKNDPVEFGAHGIFRINMKFFMEIFTAVATHLVIMIQFRTADTDVDQVQKTTSNKCGKFS